jgi:hypothetical protein
VLLRVARFQHLLLQLLQARWVLLLPPLLLAQVHH